MSGGVAPIYQTLWTSTVPSGYPNDPTPVTLGLQVRFTAPGRLVGWRYYRDLADIGEHIGMLVDGTSAELIRCGKAKHMAATGAGPDAWRNAYFNPLYRVSAGELLRLNVLFTHGLWRYEPAAIAVTDYLSYGMVVPHDAVGFFNGIYTYSTNLEANLDGGGNMYGVDVLFLPD